MNKKSREILVVDDQEGWCEAIAAVLEDAECSVRFARTYGEALAELQSRNPDLIIIDIRLEEQIYNVEGIDLLQWISEHKRWLPAIILTGHGTPALKQKTEWYGAFAFLEKPNYENSFDRNLFLKTVTEAIAAGLNRPQ